MHLIIKDQSKENKKKVLGRQTHRKRINYRLHQLPPPPPPPPLLGHPWNIKRHSYKISKRI